MATGTLLALGRSYVLWCTVAHVRYGTRYICRRSHQLQQTPKPGPEAWLQTWRVYTLYVVGGYTCACGVLWSGILWSERYTCIPISTSNTCLFLVQPIELMSTTDVECSPLNRLTDKLSFSFPTRVQLGQDRRAVACLSQNVYPILIYLLLKATAL